MFPCQKVNVTKTVRRKRMDGGGYGQKLPDIRKICVSQPTINFESPELIQSLINKPINLGSYSSSSWLSICISKFILKMNI